MANNSSKAPTKAQIEAELKETKKLLEDTQSALQDSVDVIRELKEQLNQKPQVVVQNNKTKTSKIKCISVSHTPVNVSTEPDSQGRVYSFNEYGQVQYIKYDDLLDIISSYPVTMGSGLIYIADKDFVEEQGVYDDMSVIYNKDVMDKIVYLREDHDVDMLKGMSKPLLETTIRKIAELYNNGESMEANKLEVIKKELGYDITEIAKEMKVVNAEGDV